MVLYDKACGLGDDEGCRPLAEYFLKDTWELPRPTRQLDRMRMFAAFYAAASGDSKKLARLRAAMDSSAPLRPEFDFLEACGLANEGRSAEALAIARRLREELNDEQVLRVFVRFLEDARDGSWRDSFALMEAWAAPCVQRVLRAT